MFYVIELQTTGDTTASIVTPKTTYDEALGEFHRILASAATSNVEFHSAAVLDETAISLERGSFNHPQTEPNE